MSVDCGTLFNIKLSPTNLQQEASLENLFLMNENVTCMIRQSVDVTNIYEATISIMNVPVQFFYGFLDGYY